MRSRALLFASSLILLLTLAACSKSANESATNSASPDQNAANSSNPNAPGGGMANNAKPAPAPEPVIVPAGTVLTVRLGEAVGSKISSPGQTFTATVATPVQVEGKTVIPSGASASGTVTDAKPLGRFKGGAVLQVRLDSVRINGAQRQVQTSAVTRTEKGKGKRTAVMAGGGAGVGALIGGLAGGGKGAAIGALVGGGGGTAGAAFTGNKDIVLPAESLVSFKLETPLEVK